MRCCSLELRSSEFIEKLISVSVQKPSGSDKTQHPDNKCNGFKGSLRSSLDRYNRGLELTIASTSVSVVNNSSYDSLALPMVFLKHRFRDCIMLSKNPPDQGAF